MRTKAPALLPLLLALAPAAARPESLVLTSDEAVKLALEHNPSLREKRLAIESSRAEEKTAGLRPNPVLSNATTDLTVGVTQVLELGGKRSRRLASARLQTEMAEGDSADSRRSLVLAVRSAFAGALLAKENLALAKDNVENFRRVLELNKLRFDAGDISRSDFLKVELEGLEFETDAEDATLALETAKATLKALLSEGTLPPDFDIDGDPRVPEIQGTLEALEAKALLKRPDLREAEAGVRKARADFKLAEAEGVADLSVVAGWQHTGASFGPSWFEPLYSKGPESNTMGLGLSIPLRIFDRNQGEIARARIDIDRAQARAASVRDQVRSDVETAFATMKVSKERLNLFDGKYLSHARESREIAEFAYEKGGASTLDILDAERTYRATLVAYEQARYGYLTSVAALAAASGEDWPEAPPSGGLGEGR